MQAMIETLVFVKKRVDGGILQSSRQTAIACIVENRKKMLLNKHEKMIA